MDLKTWKKILRLHLTTAELCRIWQCSGVMIDDVIQVPIFVASFITCAYFRRYYVVIARRKEDLALRFRALMCFA
ncbi:hypothetical protein BJV82DRAFT_602550 [Fennellomyces sp. T-0311]|nr:hypothetical protein BJV82DRAFT_602550 [Fennellomyces sp. T-0311]